METIDQNTHLAEELAEIATQLQRSFLVELSTETSLSLNTRCWVF
jgi:hypothetical protein